MTVVLLEEAPPLSSVIVLEEEATIQRQRTWREINCKQEDTKNTRMIRPSHQRPANIV
jgi:hypothetical protein